MQMRQLLLPLAALMLSQALLLIGHGLQLTLLPLRAGIELFTAAQIAFTGSSYFVGFVVGCLLTPFLVRRVGHIRSFAVLGSSYSVVVLLFDALPLFGPWLLLRLFTGVCIAGLYMIIESWLNDRATAATRGTLLSVYTIINLSMMMVGQQLLNLASPDGSTLFAAAAILFSVAIIPVSLTVSLAPAPLSRVRLNLPAIWRLSHVGVNGTIAAGLVTGAFWSLGPVYAQNIGLETTRLAFFMSAAVLGGAVFQLPLGRLSDHYDRRLVVFFITLAGAGVSLMLALLPAFGILPLLLAFLWGGAAMTLYAICLAHASDHADPGDIVMVGSGILLIFGLSSAFGGPLAAVLMALMGEGGLFMFSAVVLLILAVAISIRRRQHVLPVRDETEPFQNIPAIASPAIFELDPRTGEPGEGDDGGPGGSEEGKGNGG